jgi:hypothetical protein
MILQLFEKMKYVVLVSVLVASFCSNRNQEVCNKDIKVTDLSVNRSGYLTFAVTNNSKQLIEINYFSDSLYNYVPCNERKHSYKTKMWSVRTPFYGDQFKVRNLKRSEKDVFHIKVDYTDADSALIAFTYKSISGKQVFNKTYFLCLAFKDESISEFTPDFETKKTLGLMDPNSQTRNKN